MVINSESVDIRICLKVYYSFNHSRAGVKRIENKNCRVDCSYLLLETKLFKSMAFYLICGGF